MNELYTKLQDDNHLFDAYFVIKNDLSHNPGDIEIFKTFMDLALRIASFDMEFNARRKYLSEADMALTIFSESVEMTDESIIGLIKDYSSKISKASIALQKEEEKSIYELEESKRQGNQKLFEELSDIYKKMESINSQKELDDILQNIADIEAQIDKRVFSVTQQQTYESLTQGFSKLISEKMEDINHLELLNLNKEAIENFKLVFDKYNEKKSFYNKNEADLKALVTKYLFAYDSRQLFNESLIYFNHVYSTIFNGVDDDLKFKLTEWSITADKFKKRK